MLTCISCLYCSKQFFLTKARRWQHILKHHVKLSKRAGVRARYWAAVGSG